MHFEWRCIGCKLIKYIREYTIESIIKCIIEGKILNFVWFFMIELLKNNK